MARRGDLNGWWRFGIAVVGAVARLTFRIRVEGVERVPATGAAIVAANHVSALDGVLLGLVVGRRRGRPTRFLTAAEFFGKRRFGWALRLYRQIPIRRGDGDVGALDEAVRTIRSGALAGIFPEGRVNPAPEDGLQQGRTGVARIALAAGVPVVPVGMWGTNDRWPKAGLRYGRPWRPVAALSFGDPIVLEGDPESTEDTKRAVELLMSRIADRVDQARRLAAS